MGLKTRLSSHCTKRANNGVNLVTSRKVNTRLARPIIMERSGSYHIGHTPYQEALWRGSGSYTNELAPYEKALWGDQVVIQMDSPHLKRHYGGRSSSYANELTRLWRGLGSYTNGLIPYDEELLRGIR